MHEMSLAGGILKIVEDAAARDGFARVSRLVLEAGALAGVEVSALRFALEALSPGTLLEAAIIEIEHGLRRRLGFVTQEPLDHRAECVARLVR